MKTDELKGLRNEKAVDLTNSGFIGFMCIRVVQISVGGVANSEDKQLIFKVEEANIAIATAAAIQHDKLRDFSKFMFKHEQIERQFTQTL